MRAADAVVAPVPPFVIGTVPIASKSVCALRIALCKSESALSISAFECTSRFVRAAAAVVAPVPPFATGTAPVVSPSPRRLRSAWADVTPVPPRAIPRVPLPIFDASRLGISDATKLLFFPILPPPSAVHASDAVVLPVPPWATLRVPVMLPSALVSLSGIVTVFDTPSEPASVSL